MDAKDLIKISRKAKSETEAYINRYLNDGAKGWPKVCFCDSFHTGARRVEKKAVRT